jgi:four helix bundle protein
MSDFKKLEVWQKAHALALSLDRVCKRMRGPQHASLRSQAYRAAMSIPANIAEGRRKNSDKEFNRFVGYALSSSSELEYHLIVARDTKVLPEADFVSLVSQTVTVRKMLYGLQNCLSISDPDLKPRKKPEKSPQPKAGPPTAPSR